MGILDVFRGMLGRGELQKSSVGSAGVLPPPPTGGFTPVGYGLAGEQVPFPPIDWQTLYMLALHVSEVNAPIQALIRETLRSGIQIVPRYRWKCVLNGVEYDDKSEALRFCPETELVQPDEREYLVLERWLRRANRFGETLLEVMKQFLFDLNVLDNAFLVAIYEYEFDANGDIASQRLVEIVRGDPRFLRLIMSKNAEPGMTNEGKQVYFCPRDRQSKILVEPGSGPPVCPTGEKAFPAYYAFVKPGDASVRMYYAPWEVLHVKKFHPAPGYGVSPLYGVIFKIMALYFMDFFIYTAFNRERPPPGLLILRGNFESIWKAWEKLRDEVRKNPNAVYPLVIEDYDGKNGRVAEWLDFGLKPREFELIELRREMRRVIASIYGVSPVFYESTLRSGEATSGFIVTNRAVEFEQRILNEKVLPWIVERIGVRSYTYMLAPPEIRDRKTELDIKKRQVDIVATLRRMGFDARLRERDDGSWDIVLEGDPPPGMLGEPTDRALKGLRLTRKQGGEEDLEHATEREKEKYYSGNPPGPESRRREGDQRFAGEPGPPDDS